MEALLAVLAALRYLGLLAALLLWRHPGHASSLPAPGFSYASPLFAPLFVPRVAGVAAVEAALVETAPATSGRHVSLVAPLHPGFSPPTPAPCFS